MLEEDLLDLAGDDGGVQLTGEGGHLVQTGTCWNRETKIKLRTSGGESLPVDVGGNPGGLIPIIFLWAASGSRSGLEPCWERLGSDPNLRVVGSSGESKGALISGILGLVAGSPGEGGSVKFKY